MTTMTEHQNHAPAEVPMGRQLYWLVRRELWENRSVYIGPIVIGALVLFGTSINVLVGLPDKLRGLSALDPVKQVHAIVNPFSIAASVILMLGWIIGIFYSFDALNGERRDRSILFWKSLPVSDRATVLSKAAIPLLFIPMFSMAIGLIVQTLLALLSTIVTIGNGFSPAMLWTRLPLPTMTLVMLYGVTAHILWFSPIYAYFLLISAWARRAVIVWALLPFFAIGIIERVAFGTTYFGKFLKWRFLGAMGSAFGVDAMKGPIIRFSDLTPFRFFITPGLWLGLIFAALCLVAAVRLRRNREPV